MSTADLNELFCVEVKGWALIRRGKHGNVYRNRYVSFVDATDWVAKLGPATVLRRILFPRTRAGNNP
jgi:hypothetical protein